MRFLGISVVTAIVLCLAVSQHAIAQDKWRFSEFYSNADGSVQFVEMTCLNFDDQQGIASAEIRSLTTGKKFVIPIDLPDNTTANRSFLIATDNFESLPGAIVPDYAVFTGLPANFFDPNGDAISFFHNPHGTVTSRSFFTVPTDGINSLQYPLNSFAANTPRNFSGQVGSVNAGQLYGDYDDNGTVDATDYLVWRKNLETPTTIPNDSSPGWVSTEDYNVWRGNFGLATPANGASFNSQLVPEPTLISLLAALAVFAGGRRKQRQPSSSRC
jgi:hypothetical protein